ncbi:hypothetical protein [uncultured Lactobacillus sp.]|uniref:hypothetical protein n=1 Tax=uncultured Lactobacillus sp. TaxID=153152 RepID=UPI00259AF974|nr:hypothetical protein [uncultured Lactobacillus sp.]
MEKIKLSSGKEYELITCGIALNNGELTLKLLPGDDSLDTINSLFLSENETSKMTLLSEAGEELAIYNDYTRLQSIKQELETVIGYTQDEEQTPVNGKLVTIVISKIDDIEKRLLSTEQQLTELQVAICEIYETVE